MANIKIIKHFSDIPYNFRVCLYGTGKFGKKIRRLLEYFRPDIHIVAYIDSYKGGVINGLHVFKIDEIDLIRKNCDLVLITSSLCSEIVKTLMDRQFSRYKICSQDLLRKEAHYSGDHLGQIHHAEREKALKLGVGYAAYTYVEGDIVEFGTWDGWSASILGLSLALAQPYCSEQKRLLLFDSFKGLPASESIIDSNSPHVTAGDWCEGALKGASKEEVYADVIAVSGLDEDRLIVYDGWFKDTMAQLPKDTRFSMLHLDCDLYQSTVDVLEPCFSQGFISEGAILIFDDWNCHRGSPESGERKAWAEMVERFSVSYSDEGSYAISGHKLIVHSYKGMPLSKRAESVK